MPAADAAYQSLSQVLIEARTDAGLTQRALAARLKRLQSFVGKTEGGTRSLDVIEFIQIARALKIDPAKLLNRVIEAADL